MATPRTKYQVTLPDGTVATCSSHRTYTHAVAVMDSNGWHVAAYCSSERFGNERLGSIQGYDAAYAKRNGHHMYAQTCLLQVATV